MPGVDDRVVSMKFDNATFEAKMAETMKSLDKLKASLDFSNSKRGMDDLSAAGRNFSMGNMGVSIDGISTKFMALATIGITALSQITSKAISSGAQILKALSVEPILDGYREYETNMTSIQTILSNTASKGTNLDQVNAALDKLNVYSDQTIYNFGQMARNIGTFTAAGVGLDASVNSIKGIANLAALSGSSSDQASTAMYQLSQAIAAGSVKLMDWNSVVNAGMGGEVFQKALFESGKAMKTLNGVPLSMTFEQWTKSGHSFRESLQEGWITSEVLTKTLSAFTGDMSEAQIMAMGYTKQQAAELVKLGQIGKAAATQVKTITQLYSTVKESIGSGWSETFRIVLGNFTEATKLFTNINTAIGNVVSASADARNKVLQGWKDLGGRDLLIQGLKDALTGLGSVLKPIQEAFRNVFPAKTSFDLLNMTRNFANFAKSLKIGAETASNIKQIFTGFFSVIAIGREIISQFLGFIGGLIGSLSGIGGGVLDFSAGIGTSLTSLRIALVEGGGIARFFEKLNEIVHGTSAGVGAAVDRIQQRFAGLSALGDRLAAVFDKVKVALDKVWNYISTFFSTLGARISEAMKPADFNNVLDAINIGLLAGIALLLRKFMKQGLSVDFGGGVMDKIKGTLDGVTETLKAMQTQLKAKALLEIAGALGILTASIVILSLIDSAALTRALAAITVAFAQLIGSMILIDKFSGAFSGAKLTAVATGLMILSGAMVLLSIAVKNLSGLSWEELGKGLSGVSVMLVALATSTNLIANNTSGLVRAGLSMIAISVALLILSQAVKAFAGMSWGEMVKGLTGVGIGLGLLTIAMRLMPKDTVLIGPGLVAAAIGLRILAEAVSAFGQMSWEEMGKGLLGIGLGLGIIALAMQKMPLNLPITASGLLILSVALNVMALAIRQMGSMGIDQLGKGIGTLAAALLILTVAVNNMKTSVRGAAALLIISGALIVLATALAILSRLSITQLATGLATIAAAFLILGVAGHFLAPIAPALMAVGVALALVGATFALFGVGAMLVAKAFEILAKAGKAGTQALIESITMFLGALPVFIATFVESLILMSEELTKAIPVMVELIGVMISQMILKLIELTPQFGILLGVMISTGLTLLRQKFPELIATGLALLIALLQGIRDNIGQITTLIAEIVVNFCTALANKAGDIAKAGLDVLVAFLKGISDNISKVVDGVGKIVTEFITALGNNANKIVTSGVNVVIKFIEGIGQNAVKLANAAGKTIVDFLNGLTSAVNTYAPQIRTATLNLGIAIINGITGGVGQKIGELWTWCKNLGASIAWAVGSLLNVLVQAGKDVVSGLWNGIVSMKDWLVGKIKGVGGWVSDAFTSVLDIFSPSKVFENYGKMIMLGLGNGIVKNSTAIQDDITEVAQNIVDAYQATINRIPDSLAGMKNFNPVITPVLDLSEVQSGAKSLNYYMGKYLGKATVIPSTSFLQAKQIAATATIGISQISEPISSGSTEISFEQNIYSPEALSTSDIYRSTRSQIILAKEELNIR